MQSPFVFNIPIFDLKQTKTLTSKSHKSVILFTWLIFSLLENYLQMTYFSPFFFFFLVAFKLFFFFFFFLTGCPFHCSWQWTSYFVKMCFCLGSKMRKVQSKTKFTALCSPNIAHCVPQYCNLQLVHIYKSTLFHLGLVISNSASIFLVWLQRHQWYRQHRIGKYSRSLNLHFDLNPEQSHFDQTSPQCDLDDSK